MVTNGLASTLPVGLAVGATLCLFCVLLIISVVDLKSLRIPDILSLPLIAAGLGMAFAVPGVYAMDYLIGALAAYLLFAGIGAAYFRLRGIDGLGLGDAKLFAAAGAWLGWQNLPVVLLLATVGGLLQAMMTRKPNRDTPLAFGPWIAFGFWAVWIWSCWGNVIWPR